jgi:poly(3-hydroxybutyrate) depolymerase
MRTAISALLLLLALLAAGTALAQDKPPKLPKWKAGKQEGTVLIDGKAEAFTALVPKGYSTKKTYPTVLLAHGNGGKAANFLTNVKGAAGKKPPLLISLERCDNNQDAVGYVPKYLAELRKQFAIDPGQVYALGFSGGGFRLWDDVVCKAEQLPQFRGVVLVGCAKQSFDPPEKPENAPTVVFVGDPKDPNYGKTGTAAQDKLRELGYEVIVHEHKSGHSVPRKQLTLVFEWIAKTVKAAKKGKKKK